jgi:Flp pilus assembly protein TadG
MSSHRKRLVRFARATRGASLVEYALLLFVILVVAFLAFQTLGKSTRLAADKATMAFTGS